MEVPRILAEIDAQIAKLQQARELLAGSESPVPAPAKKSVGRPRKEAAQTAVKSSSTANGKKRNLSPEARKRIAEAQKRRWAERKKSE